jgi:hypothetical protein
MGNIVQTDLAQLGYGGVTAESIKGDVSIDFTGCGPESVGLQCKENGHTQTLFTLAHGNLA